MYDTEMNNWKVLAVKLPCGVTNSAAISISSNKILIFGGG